MKSSLLFAVMSALAIPACSSDGPGGTNEPDEPRKSSQPTSPGSANGSAPSPNTGGGTSDGGTNSGPAHATVRVHYPVGSHHLGVTGDASPLSNTPTPMKDAGSDTWELALGEISAPVSFKPVLDSTPCKGPNYVVRPGQTLEVYPRFVATKGTVSVKWAGFESKSLPGTKRDVRLYLPPTYEENTTARFPVLYLHDGQTAFGTLSGQLVFIGGDTKLDDAMDKGADTGEIAEAIIVAIDSPVTGLSQEARVAELTPTNNETDSKGSGKGPQYLAMVVDELKPMVDAELRTRPTRESTFMGGASIGGLFSDWVGLTRGDVFAGVFGLSSSAWWDGEMIVALAKASQAGPTRADRVYVDVGDGEDAELMVESNKRLFQAYVAGGYVEGTTLKSEVVKKGAHNAGSFAARLPAALAHVLGPGR